MKVLPCFLSLLLCSGVLNAVLTQDQKNLFNAIYADKQNDAIKTLADYVNKGGDLLIINDDPSFNRSSTLLLEAIKEGKVDVFNNFLYPKIFSKTSKSSDNQKKEYINYVGKEGKAALALAIEYEPDKIAKELAKSELVDVNLKNEFGQTPIFDAVYKERKEIVKELLNRQELDLDIVDNYQESILFFVRIAFDIDIFKTMLNKIKPKTLNQQNYLGKTALMDRVDAGDLDKIKVLLEQNSIDVNVQNNEGNTALHIAVQENNIEAVKALLGNKNIDVNKKNKENKTPIELTFEKAFMENDKIAQQIYELLNNVSGHDANNNKLIEDIRKNKIDINKINNINAAYLLDIPILMWAIILKNAPLVQKILARKDLQINKGFEYGTYLLAAIFICVQHKDNDFIPIIKALLNDSRTDLTIELVDRAGNKIRVIDFIKGLLGKVKSEGKENEFKELLNLLEPVIQKEVDRPIDEFKNALASIK